MAFWYYVKSGGGAGGTTNGRYASEQSGAFSGLTDYYDNISEAINNAGTAPAAGDFIMVSDAHSHDYGGSFGDLISEHTGVLTIISVEDGDVTAYSPWNGTTGGYETGNSTMNIGHANGTMVWWGMRIESGSSSGIWIQNTNARVVFNECLLQNDRNGSGRLLYISNDGSSVVCNDCTFKCTNAAMNLIAILGGSSCEIYGGSYDDAIVSITDFTAGFFYSGGARLHVYGMDLSGMSNAATSYLVSGIGDTRSIEDLVDIKFVQCNIPSLVQYMENTMVPGSWKRAEFIACDDSAPARYELHTGLGKVVMDATNYITGQQKLQNSGSDVQATYLVTTDSEVSRQNPLAVKIPVANVDLTQAPSNELKLYVGVDGTGITFDNHTLVLVVTYSDATVPALMKFASSAGTKTGDWLPHPKATPGALTTSSSVWNTAPDAEYELTVTPSSPDNLPPIVHEAYLYVCDHVGSDTLLVDTEIRAA